MGTWLDFAVAEGRCARHIPGQSGPTTPGATAGAQARQPRWFIEQRARDRRGDPPQRFGYLSHDDLPRCCTRYLAWSFWQCIASAVTSAPSSSMLSRSVENMGISLVLRATSSCPRTIPPVCVRADSRCRHRPPAVAEPRRDLPSTAITRNFSDVVARSAAQAPTTTSRPFASILLMVLRIVDSDGTSPVTPSLATAIGDA